MTSTGVFENKARVIDMVVREFPPLRQAPIGADDATVLRWARAYVAALARSLPLAAAALFGSRSRGTSLRTSDADIAIVSPTFEGLNSLQRLDHAYLPEPWAAAGANIELEIVTFTPNELLGLRRPIAWDVLADGIPLTDDGTFAAARAKLQAALDTGVLQRTQYGWRYDLGWFDRVQGRQ